ncbi:MAG: hypothetical protein JNL42_16735 [Anaerolineae bacterium]|nr:hypothetical protein [Anaerolineae bacterium]
MDDHELLGAYENTLAQWIASTGKTQKELCRLTRYFQFGGSGDARPMGEDTFSKRIHDLPFRIEGKRSLYRILGVLHLCGAVPQAEDIQRFLNDCRIDPPVGMTWGDIWRGIEDGVRQYRQDQRLPSGGRNPGLIAEPPASVDDLPPSRGRTRSRTQRAVVFALIGVVVLAGTLGFTMLLSRNVTEVAVPTARPTFSPSPPVSEAAKASFGAITATDPGLPCLESILNVETRLTTDTRDTGDNDVIGLVAVDANGTVVVSRLLFFWSPNFYDQTLAVNLAHLNAMAERPLTIRLYDTGYESGLQPGASSMASFEFIQATGRLLAEITVDPAELVPSCRSLPIQG